MSLTLREAYEVFLDRGAPIFKGERRRPAGGMNASCWRKMCKDIRLWKDLAKANVVFEEVTRGQRAMDFDLFQTALVIAAERKNVTAADMMGFVQHYATSYSSTYGGGGGGGGGGDDSSVNSMGSGGSLSSMGSMGSMSSITSGRIRRVKKGRKKKRGQGQRKVAGGSGQAMNPSSYSEEGKTHQQYGGGGLGGGGLHLHSHAQHKGIATTSILEETKDSREGMSSPEMPLQQQQQHFASPFGLLDAQQSQSQFDGAAQAKQPHSHGNGQAKPSLKSFSKTNDAKGEYDKRLQSTLESINSALQNRESLSEEELDATGFSWEVKERLNVKVQEDPSTWGWAADGE